MDILETQTMVLNVSDLHPNEGQMEAIGVHANPRQISEGEYQKLLASLREDNLTGILQEKVYNYEGEWIVLDGNMRLRALQELGIEKVQCTIVPEDTPAKVLEKIIILSNSTFGEWDIDALANWNADLLKDWGVDVPPVPDEDALNGLFEDDNTQKGEKGLTISVDVPKCFEDNIADIKAALVITLAEWQGCGVR